MGGGCGARAAAAMVQAQGGSGRLSFLVSAQAEERAGWECGLCAVVSLWQGGGGSDDERRRDEMQPQVERSARFFNG